MVHFFSFFTSLESTHFSPSPLSPPLAKAAIISANFNIYSFFPPFCFQHSPQSIYLKCKVNYGTTLLKSFRWFPMLLEKNLISWGLAFKALRDLA
jgi:hypothetical protein